MNISPRSASNPQMRRCMPGLYVVVAIGLLAMGAEAAIALDVGSRAPEVGLEDLSGKPVRLGALRGKVVLVDFWASWCEPCREEMPVLERLYRRYKDQGLVVIGVSQDRSEQNMRSFLARTRVSFPIVHDVRHEVAKRYRPPKMPSSYLIDQRGIVRHVSEGYRAGDAEKLDGAIKSLLAKK